MKTPRPPIQPTRPVKATPKPGPDQALRQCEEAAGRIRAGAEELAACWTALGIEMAAGAPGGELLRRRAWCNVLELRLKEHAKGLEDARHSLDRVWSDAMLAAQGRELFQHRHRRLAGGNLFDESWALLLQPKSEPVSPPKPSAATK